MAAIYFLIYFLIATTLHSNLGIDNAIENYNAQTLALSYSPRNPPLYDWILFGIQTLAGPKATSFAILNYGSLYACVIVLYRVSRRVISDPRLQALSIYAYSLLWDIGHESHRILTHSNLMILAIAASILMLLKLSEERTLGRYLWLGFWIAFGLLSKFGYAAFIGIVLAAALAVPRYRSIVLDRRIAGTLVVAGLPVALYFWASLASHHSIVSETETVLRNGSRSAFTEQLARLTRSLLGYVVPLLPLAIVVFLRLPARRETETDGKRDFRLLLGIVISIGVGAAVFWALALGSTQLRPRYFHALLILSPVLLFVWLDRYRWPLRPIHAFLGMSAFIALGIMVEQTLPRLMPSEFLCGSCRPSVPYHELGRELQARFGATPTLVGLDVPGAGQLRAAVPGARVQSLSQAHYRPPFRNDARPCVLVWLEDGDTPTAQAAAIAGKTVETIDVPWFQPLMSKQRVSRFNLAVLADSFELCR